MIKVWVDIELGISGLYDDQAEYAFGPVFGSDEEPDEFLEWMEPRLVALGLRWVCDLDLDRLSSLVDRWRLEIKDNDNEALGERVCRDTEATTLSEQKQKAKELK